MRPGLTREIVRNSTAYRVGRVALDVLIALQWICTVVFLALYFRALPSIEGQAGLFAVSLAVGGCVVMAFASLVAREIGQAIFDMADCALTNRGAKPGE